MNDQIQFNEHTKALIEACNQIGDFHIQVGETARLISDTFNSGGKVLIAGNGGSAAEAQHFSDELVGRYRSNRRPYPVIALTADSMVVTCISNDYGYEFVFERQIEALGASGDIFIGLTTSGSSKNILLAAEKAKEMGMKVVAFMGKKGPFEELSDIAVKSPSDKAAIVQELHLHAIHLICETFEPAE